MRSNLHSALRPTARLGAGLAGVAVLTLAGMSGAAAHVTVSPPTAVADSYAVLTVGVPHGCGESPTTKVAIQIPESLLSVTPSVNPNWDVEKVMVQLAEPVTDSHGNEITERVGEVVYTAKTPLPNSYRDAFELSVKMPNTPGETLVFPAIQTCEEGETAWAQVAEAGAEDAELDYPAPLVTLTAPADEAGEEPEVEPVSAGSDDATDTGDTETVASTSSSDSDGGGSTGLSIAALVVGALGLLAGGTALLRGRSRA